MKKIYISPSDQTGNRYAAGDTNEAVQCRKIAAALVAALMRCGFAAMTNTEDGDGAMVARVRQSNEWGADLHLCVHTNAHDGTVKGTRLFCYDLKGEGYRACRAVMDTLAPITPGESDGISVLHFYEVKYANAPTVYLEAAFHDNEEEAAWIVAHTREIAEAVCRGLCGHYGVDYVPPEVPLYRVQVGAFRVRENAEKLRDDLRKAGYADVYITEGT